jgi:putative NADH-flavin reductase
MKFVIVRKTGAASLYLKEKDSLKVAQDKNDAYQFKTEKAAQKALESLRDKFNSPSLVKYLSVERF